MILIDFRNWDFDKSLGYLPNAQKELLQRDYDVLKNSLDVKVVDLGAVKYFNLSSLFFENKKIIAVSPVNNIAHYYNSIDVVLAVKNKEVIDYTEAADEEVYFYGQNSLVSHLTSEIALCGINEFTDESLFEEYCEDFELTPFSFELPKEIFTREMAFFVKDTLLICLDYIQDKKEKKQLFSLLKNSGIALVSFTKEQVEKGVFNCVNFEDTLMITKQSFDVFTDQQKDRMAKIDVIVKIVELPFLEKAGVLLRDIIF